MRKKSLVGILFGIFILGTLSIGSAADYNFEVNYNGTGFTLVSALGPLTQSITAGDNFTYTINTIGTDYFEVINAAGWNPWLFIGISDTADGVIFDYQTELFLGTTPVLTIPFTGGSHSTASQGASKYLGIIDFGPSIPVATTFDRVVLSAQILPATTTPFVFTQYMPSELSPADLLVEYIPDGGPMLTDYDNFNTKKYNGCKSCINSEKWMGGQRGNYVTELQRGIKAKRARMSHRSWGSMDSDLGMEQGRNRMFFRNSANMSGACFVPRVKKYSMQNCSANVGASQVRVRYLGKFYDTDNADLGGDDGMVLAEIQMSRYVDSVEKKPIFGISGWVGECEGVDCATTSWSTGDGTNDPNLYFGAVKASTNKKELCVGYDRANHEFVISYGKDVRTVDGTHDLPAFGVDVPSDQAWHVIETRTDVENCSAGAISGFIDADIDNVKIIRELP